jgi:NAD(P)-dependent dehydrogenase (short-subunit alcohol dehydrogenase family)
MSRLRDKRVLVFGGSAGIGLAILQRFAKEGARLANADLQAPAGGLPVDLLDLRCDIADGEAVRTVVEQATAHLGGLDAMINAAAALTRIGPVSDLPPDEWEHAIRVNLTGAYHASRCCIPHLLAAGGGSIVHICSEIGVVGAKGRSAYSSSKAGLIQLARVLALDHAEQGIRVNALSPGAVVTDRLLSRFGSAEAAETALAPLYPMGRLGRPEEIAAAALFLASEDSSFMTGANLVVDGGYTAR